MVCDQVYNIVLQIILADFEVAAMNAVKCLFRETLKKGCFFYLTKNVWIVLIAYTCFHTSLAGLIQKYIQDTEFANKIRHLPALAYLSPEEIPAAFRLLEENVLPKKAEKVTEWFRKYYVEGPFKLKQTGHLSIQKIPPEFPPQLWSL